MTRRFERVKRFRYYLIYIASLWPFTVCSRTYQPDQLYFVTWLIAVNGAKNFAPMYYRPDGLLEKSHAGIHGRSVEHTWRLLRFLRSKTTPGLRFDPEGGSSEL